MQRAVAVAPDPVLVMNRARALHQIPRDLRGLLHRVAIGIKDIIRTKVWLSHLQRTSNAFDSSAVAILRAAGALIIGKRTTTEFTLTNSGPDNTNPHGPNRTPVGSSCGSAAAVADLQVSLSLGSQTGGSIIRPASFTGVFAMKPTWNAISLEGQKSFSPTFDTFGLFSQHRGLAATCGRLCPRGR
ncbi:hypothetical protein AJ79_00196 [Helicocarpus griseus UAMH5409]|uniref:Amidase domain-containing protein n=1 Tax=Helicocarpus griseus UAMH5409 TaxID=1447875 RepID=A0A2B7YCM1_9EURO|nr:hypothetical protein AJ79_00196 [Helicocarpus griseus UAMH5409]